MSWVRKIFVVGLVAFLCMAGGLTAETLTLIDAGLDGGSAIDPWGGLS